MSKVIRTRRNQDRYLTLRAFLAILDQKLPPIYAAYSRGAIPNIATIDGMRDRLHPFCAVLSGEYTNLGHIGTDQPYADLVDSDGEEQTEAFYFTTLANHSYSVLTSGRVIYSCASCLEWDRELAVPLTKRLQENFLSFKLPITRNWLLKGLKTIVRK